MEDINRYSGPEDHDYGPNDKLTIMELDDEKARIYLDGGRASGEASMNIENGYVLDLNEWV